MNAETTFCLCDINTRNKAKHFVLNIHKLLMTHGDERFVPSWDNENADEFSDPVEAVVRGQPSNSLSTAKKRARSKTGGFVIRQKYDTSHVIPGWNDVEEIMI